MPDRVPATTEFASRSLRLDTLVRLRWLAVVGQATAVVWSPWASVFRCRWPVPCPHRPVGAGQHRPPAALLPDLRIGHWPALTLLAYDLVQLAGLLYLTGGLDNPFAFLLLVPVIVSATALPPRADGGSRRYGGGHGEPAGAPPPAAALVSGREPDHPARLHRRRVGGAGARPAPSPASIPSAWRKRRASSRRALTATEMVLAREQHLSALDGLAAAAAHELGTPLATIALVAKEMEREFPPTAITPTRTACHGASRNAAATSSAADHAVRQPDDHLARVPLSHLLEEVVAPYRAFAAEIVVGRRTARGRSRLAGAIPPSSRASPIWSRTPSISPAPGDHRHRVERRRRCRHHRRRRSRLRRRHHGADRRALRHHARPRSAPADPEAGGLGLGFFIAKTLLERSGARLTLGNREPPDRGAVVNVAWPRALMDRETHPIVENQENRGDE